MTDDAAPVLRIVRGNPDDTELAAVTAVLAGLASQPQNAGDDPAASARSRWSDPASRLRVAVRPGRDGWRASAFPG